jgi:hypothetical protein
MQIKSIAYDLRELPYKPNDFGGVKWGDSPDKLGDEKKFIRENRQKQIVVYDLSTKNVFFNKYRAGKTRYLFSYNQLVSVRIYFQNKHGKDDLLLPHFAELFGQPIISESDKKTSVTRYIWMDNEFTIDLSMHSKSNWTLDIFNDHLARELSPK